MSQKTKLLEILSNGQWHCLTNEMYLKDDRSRLSELRKEGHIFSNDDNMWCEDPAHRHYSRVKLRRLESSLTLKSAPQSPCNKDSQCWHRKQFSYCLCKIVEVKSLF